MSIFKRTDKQNASFKLLSNGEEVKESTRVHSIVVHQGFNKISGAEIYILDGDPAKQEFAASICGTRPAR